MKFRHRGIEGLAPGIDDYGPLRAQLIQVEADGFTDTPPDAVAHHRLADRARESEADARTGIAGLADAESCEQGPGETGPPIVNPAKIL